MAQISNLTLSAVSVEEAGEASGVNNTMRQLGSTLGAAVMGAVLITALTGGITSGIEASSSIPSGLKPQIEAEVGSHAEDFEFAGSNSTTDQIPPEVAAEIQTISKSAITDAERQVFVYSVVFIFLGLLVSLKLPKVKNLERNQSAARH